MTFHLTLKRAHSSPPRSLAAPDRDRQICRATQRTPTVDDSARGHRVAPSLEFWKEQKRRDTPKTRRTKCDVHRLAGRPWPSTILAVDAPPSPVPLFARTALHFTGLHDPTDQWLFLVTDQVYNIYPSGQGGPARKYVRPSVSPQRRSS